MQTAFLLMRSSRRWRRVASPAKADQTHVAVAANFGEPAREIAALFKEKTGHEAMLITGASGAFYTQITHGAPFEVFLSADDERPRRPSRWVCGSGQPVHLRDRQARAVEPCRRRDQGRGCAEGGRIPEVSIANPTSAPYGAAAVETMKALGVWDALQAQARSGQQHRPGVPVRRHAQRRTRLRRAGAALRNERRDALGGSADASFADPAGRGAVENGRRQRSL